MAADEYDVVVFAPFAGVLPHARLERRVANTLANSGAQVLFVSCSGAFGARCVVMESRGLEAGSGTQERDRICGKCTRAAHSLNQEIQPFCDVVDVADLLGVDDWAVADDIFHTFLEKPSPSYVWSGIPFGAYWAYETVLKYKSAEQTPEFTRHLTETAKSGAIAFAAGRRVSREHCPSVAMLLEVEYGINRSFLQAFSGSQTKLFSFSNAGNFSKWENGFQVFSVDDGGIPNRNFSNQLFASEAPLIHSELDALRMWFDDRVDQRSALVYSSPRARVSAAEIRGRLGIGSHDAVLVPSSSPDERHAVTFAQLLPKGTAPYDPEEHFRFAQLLVEAARANPDVAFVYRLHPRMAPNHRDPRRSPLLDRLILAAGGDGRPENLILNTPDQELSLHDVAMIAHAGLNWSSTAGLELLALGIPVVGMSDAPVAAYPSYLNFKMAASTVRDISGSLREAIDTGWSPVQMRLGARYVVSSVNRTVIPIDVAQPNAPRAPRRLASFLRGSVAAPVRRTLTPLRQFLTSLSTHSESLGQPVSLGRGSSIEAGGRDWAELIDDWVEWRRIPEGGADTEDLVLRGFAAHVVDRLAPWDGSEGAIGGLREFASSSDETGRIGGNL